MQHILIYYIYSKGIWQLQRIDVPIYISINATIQALQTDALYYGSNYVDQES